MAPNADQNRLRQRLHNHENDSLQESSDQAMTRTTAKNLKDIKSTEVVIDGIIYDLKSFHHPGGDSVLVFGGNDVTVQYKMIHPYHTDKHLEKMKAVGKVTDAKQE
jgi:Cytochrome b involved in lipid metabolism